MQLLPPPLRHRVVARRPLRVVAQLPRVCLRAPVAIGRRELGPRRPVAHDPPVLGGRGLKGTLGRDPVRGRAREARFRLEDVGPGDVAEPLAVPGGVELDPEPVLVAARQLQHR